MSVASTSVRGMEADDELTPLVDALARLADTSAATVNAAATADSPSDHPMLEALWAGYHSTEHITKAQR